MAGRYLILWGFKPDWSGEILTWGIDRRLGEMDSGYSGHALGYGIHTHAETVEELRSMVKDAVRCSIDGGMEIPKIIRLHFVRDEVLA